jgi:hypothetical protein
MILARQPVPQGHLPAGFPGAGSRNRAIIIEKVGEPLGL